MMRVLICCIIGLSFFSCQNSSPDLIALPRAYPHVNFPPRNYETWGVDYCDFRFDKNTSATIEKKTSYFDEKPPNECWFNLYYPDLQSTVHFSSYDLRSPADLEQHSGEAFKLAYEHTARANYIEEKKISTTDASGFIFDLQGPSASPYQFYLTDSSRHFVRGALYFDARPNRDSLDIIIDYMKGEMDVMIRTFRWN